MVLGVPKATAGWLGLLLGTGALYFTTLWGTTPAYVSDTQAYQYLASRLAALQIDQLPYRTIGYPIILVLTGSTDHLTPMLYVVQLAFHLSVVWMIVALAQRFALPRVASLLLAVTLMSPPIMQKVTMGLTETSCEFFVVLTVLFFVRWAERRRASDAVLAGFAVAIAGLIRPTYQVFGLFMALAALIWLWRRAGPRKAMLSAVFLATGTMLLIGGVTVFYAFKFGYLGPSPMIGWHLTNKTSLFIEHLPDSELAKASLVEARNATFALDPKHQGADYVWPIMDELAAKLGMTRAQASSHMLLLNLRLIAARPGDYLASVFTAAAGYVLPSTSGIADDRGAPGLGFLLLHLASLFAFILQLFGMGGLSLVRRLGVSVRGPFNRPAARVTWWFTLALVAYTAGVSVMTEIGDPRLRTPTDPLILLVAFGGIYMIGIALRGTRVQQEGAKASEVTAAGQ